jgi:hypothetical protein
MARGVKRVTNTERATYLRHIKRLQDDRALLTDMLVTERRLRRDAYKFYAKRLRSRFWFVMDLMTFGLRGTLKGEK